MASNFPKIVLTVLMGSFSCLSVAASNQRNLTVASMGDSITVAFSADIPFKADPSVSWSTGEKLVPGFESHLQKLKRHFPDALVQGKNFAKSGSTIEDVAAQVAQVNAVRADYVTLLIGANDVCDWTANYAASEKKFLDTLKQYLDSMITTNPNVRIVLSAIPDLIQVWSLSKDEASCQSVWKKIPMLCTPVFGESATDGSRIALKAHVRQTNAKIGELAKVYAKNVRFTPSVGTATLAKDDISTYDCFHPSVKGQNTLSQYTWSQGWFAERK